MPRTSIPELTLLKSSVSSYLANGVGPLPIRALLTDIEHIPYASVPLPRERELYRKALVDLAPDREELLMSATSAEELRNALKIRLPPGYAEQKWMTPAQTRPSTRLDATRVSKPECPSLPLKQCTTAPQKYRSVSDGQTYMRPSGIDEVLTNDKVTRVVDNFQKEEKMPPTAPPKASPKFRHTYRIRRSISTSAISNMASRIHATSARQARRAEGATITRNNKDASPSALLGYGLSNPDKVISPCALGPSHTLILYTAAGAQDGWSGERILAAPINALLFALHVPNLCLRSDRVFPHRTPRELPRVLMRVSNLEGWKPLIAYMHTRNQAALMRCMIPEWMRDLMHPLPPPTQPAMGMETKDGVTRRLKSKKSFLRFGTLKRSRLTSSTSQTSIVYERQSFASPRTVESVAREIADAEADNGAQGNGEFEGTTLIETLMRLNNLQDNLEQIGYFGEELWDEMMSSWMVLSKAICLKAQMDGMGQSEESEESDA